jgi:glycosyltransferase involved in cell wall biosynthesis
VDLAPVSVVIPAYNSEEFIGEAIQSVQAQTLPVSETIVVDDGSSDRTAEVAADFGTTVIRQAHRGISAARNAGIRAATQEWIALHDADDIWQARKIEYQWKALARYPDVGMISCDLTQWRHGEPRPGFNCAPADAQNIESCLRYFPRVTADLLSDTISYNSPTFLIRRDLFFSAGFFDEDVEYVEGVECYLRLMARCPIAMIKLPLAMQRVHQRNTSADSVGMRLSWISMIDMIREQPDKYPAGAADVLEKGVFEQLIPLGRTLLTQGKPHQARDLFKRSLKMKFSNRALLLWAVSFLGPNASRQLAAIRQGNNSATSRIRDHASMSLS